MTRRSCFCGHKETNPLVVIPIVTFDGCPISKSNQLSIVKCSNPRCGFIFNDELSSQEDFNKYYESNNMYFFKRDKVSDIVQKTFQVLKVLMTKDSSILDIGCGSGELLLHLKSQGYNVSGLDTSPNCIENLVENGVNMYTGDVFKNNIDQQFDVVVLSHVVEHIYDLENLPNVLEKYLKPNGILYVEVPDTDEYHSDTSQPPYQEYNTEHINHFDEMSLTQLFMRFKVVSMNKKIIQPNEYGSIYGIFKKRIFRDEFHSNYIEKSQLEFEKYKGLSASVWGVGEFAYKLLPHITVKSLIDDNVDKIGKTIKGLQVLSHKEFDYKSDIISTIKSKLFFYVFDLDGTLIDSERLHYEALGWDISFEEYEHFLNTTGIQLDPESRKLKNERMVYQGVKWIPGAEELVDHIHKNNLNHVVVTNSSNNTVEKFKEQLPGLRKLTNWVTREDYEKPKPDPECYQLAMKKFYKNEKKILGFENTLLGKQSLSSITENIYMISQSSTFKEFTHSSII
jgi:HAD superfamily hydrolase (TIGR01509 family)